MKRSRRSKILRGSIIAALFLSAIVAFIRWHGLSKLPQQWWYPCIGHGGSAGGWRKRTFPSGYYTDTCPRSRYRTKTLPVLTMLQHDRRSFLDSSQLPIPFDQQGLGARKSLLSPSREPGLIFGIRALAWARQSAALLF